MNWCIIIPILVGIISAILGYLLGRYVLNNKAEDSGENISELKERILNLENNLELCRKNKLQLQNDLEACNKSKASLTLDLNAKKNESNTDLGVVASSFSGATILTIPFDAEAAKIAYGKKIKQDDLKIVEGIGPKIEGLFHNFDIKTWKALSETSIEKCQEVLNSGGERYRIHKPGTWPKQALLAYQGRWKELVKWQDELDGGKA